MSASFKVYVVDDDPVVLDIMHAILEPDCQVETFPSAEDCLMQLESEKPDFFLLDVNLPGMDGYTLCRRIKDTPALRNIPVTFVSSNDTIEERVTGYDAGGEDFIVKPFEPEELLRKLLVAQNMIAGQRSLAVQAEEAELLSSLVMANMDETGILLQFNQGFSLIILFISHRHWDLPTLVYGSKSICIHTFFIALYFISAPGIFLRLDTFCSIFCISYRLILKCYLHACRPLNPLTNAII